METSEDVTVSVVSLVDDGVGVRGLGSAVVFVAPWWKAACA